MLISPTAVPGVISSRVCSSCHVTHYIYRSLDDLSITLRYSGHFGLVCNSPVQGQVIRVLIRQFQHASTGSPWGTLHTRRVVEWGSKYIGSDRCTTCFLGVV
ncbi:hypothetical protein ACN42_g3721 [Penicillium freii]|uniref:Uncharacterized protein n=1 Tax=Penicillium freii TaxID=48697 RepID=A0A101MMQ6_PENFR|nr:hypothetical protein ACN42_g3721 [Penicillium freii]